MFLLLIYNSTVIRRYLVDWIILRLLRVDLRIWSVLVSVLCTFESTVMDSIIPGIEPASPSLAGGFFTAEALVS